MTLFPLTKRQHEVMAFIERYIARCQYAPSLEEIRRGLGLSAISTVHKHLENLRKKGAIRRSWNRPRYLDITSPFTCPTCGQNTPVDLSLSSIQEQAKPVESVEKLDGPHQRVNADTTLTAPGTQEVPRHG